jgi:hypothetical protein
MGRHPSSGRPWKRLQQQVFDEESYCVRCGQCVDQTLPYNHPMARSVDHLLPRQLDGTDGRDNLRLAHRACNTHASTPAGLLGLPAPAARATVGYEPHEWCADCGHTMHLHRDRLGYGLLPSLDGIGRSRDMAPRA